MSSKKREKLFFRFDERTGAAAPNNYKHPMKWRETSVYVLYTLEDENRTTFSVGGRESLDEICAENLVGAPQHLFINEDIIFQYV